MKHPPAALLAAFVLALAAAPAQAQRPTVSFGLAAGPTFPLGDLGDLVDMGWHAQALVSFGAGVQPLGVRAELLYQQLEGDEVEARQLAAFLSGVLASPNPGFTPYLLGGAGVYNLDTDDDRIFLLDEILPGSVAGSSTELGVNVGVGVDIGMVGYNLVLEALYHHVFGDGLDQQTLPISIGVRF